MSDLMDGAVDHMAVTYDCLSSVWRSHPADEKTRKELLDFTTPRFTTGTAGLLSNPSRKLPPPKAWIKGLHPVLGLPWWLIYLKIAIPEDAKSLLPVIWYVGSGSGTKYTNGKTGGDARAHGHVHDAEHETCQDSDEFHRMWKDHSEEYDLYFLEVWLARDLVFRGMTDGEV